MKDLGPKIILMNENPNLVAISNGRRWFRRISAKAMMEGDLKVEVEATKAPFRDARYTVRIYPQKDGHGDGQAPKPVRGTLEELTKALAEEFRERALTVVRAVSELLNSGN